MANISIGNPYVLHQYIRRYDGGSRKYGAFLTVELLSQDQVLNTSTAKLSYSLGYPGSGAMWLNYKNTGPTIQLGYNPNGTVYSYNTAKKIENFYATGSNSDVNKSTVLATWTVVIKHNSSGEGYLQAEYIWDNRATADYMPVDSTGFTEIINLPTINSATKISVAPAVLESGNETITATAFNDTNKTTVSYSLDNSNWTDLVVMQTATGGVLPIPPIAYNTLKPLIGTKTTGTVYVRAQTWLADGITRVGSDQLVQFTVQTGVIPMSWYDDMNGGVGVTIGKKATGPGFVIGDTVSPMDADFTGAIPIGLDLRKNADNTNYGVQIKNLYSSMNIVNTGDEESIDGNINDYALYIVQASTSTAPKWSSPVVVPTAMVGTSKLSEADNGGAQIIHVNDKDGDYVDIGFYKTGTTAKFYITAKSRAALNARVMNIWGVK